MSLGRVVENMPSRDQPSHPYTRALLDSAFEPDSDRRREVKLLQGEIPSALNLPPGCAFAACCPRASDLCRQMRPVLQAHAEAQAACHHPIVAG